LLRNILGKINGYNLELQSKGEGHAQKINGLPILINNMNKFVKILFGAGVVLALALVAVFSTNLINSPSGVQVKIGGETINVDSLVSDLNLADSSFDEPTVDDSDLLNDLVNANDYQI